jgi:curved DNA-binding protein CbpA
MLTIPETLDLERFELESKVLAAALKQSVDLGDPDGADHAHKQLFGLLRANHQSPAGRLMASPVFNPISAPGGNGGSHHNGQDEAVEAHPPAHPSFIATDALEGIMASDDEFSGAKILESPEPNLATIFSGEAEAEEGEEEEIPNLAALFSDDYHGASTLSPTAAPVVERGIRKTITDQMPSIDLPKPAVADNVAAPPVSRPKRLHKQPDRDTTAETEKLFASIDSAKDVYAVLGVSQYASYELIHKSFLKLSRKLLLSGARGQNRRDLERLRSLWIAHDILMDPKTRNDYDFRSIRSGKGEPKPPKQEGGTLSKAAMKIGELLQESGLLEPTELEIACDMHKAMPEMQFGRFLVKQGFIEDNQLEAVLLGQRLIQESNITIEQFKELMELVNKGTGIRAALLEKGFMNKYEIEQILGSEEPVVPKTDGFKPPPPPATRRAVAATSLAKVSFGHLDDEEAQNQEPAAEEKKETKPAPAHDAPKDAKPAASPTSRVQKEIKITNARLLALLEEHGENFQSPELTAKTENRVGGSTYGEIDLIAESEIDPQPDSPEDPTTKKPARRQPKPKK